MSSARRWINTRVVMDMTSGAVLAREGYFYVGPLALAEGEGKTPEQLAEELAAAQKVKDEAIAEAAKLRKQIADLSKNTLNDDDRKLFDKLKADQKKAEDDKLAAQGDYEKLRQQLVDSHAAEKKALEEKVNSMETTLRNTFVGREFASASALFGKDGKTILTPAIAEAYYGRYVEVQPVEGSTDRQVVVKNRDGVVILDPKTGKPAAFADAMAQLIESMPDKDAVLRGSGKTGSGNSGGGQGGGDRKDLANPKTAQDFNDPKVREEVQKKHNAAGGIQSGSIFDRKS